MGVVAVNKAVFTPNRTSLQQMERSVTAAAAQLGSVVARAAARRCRPLLLPPARQHTMLPCTAQQQRAAARLGRLLSSLAPRASAGVGESAGATAASPPAAPPAAALLPAQQPASGYRMPPKEIADIVDAAPEPLLSFSPDRKMVLQVNGLAGWSADAVLQAEPVHAYEVPADHSSLSTCIPCS